LDVDIYQILVINVFSIDLYIYIFTTIYI